MSLSHMGEVNLRKAEAAAEEGDLPRAKDLYQKAIGCFGQDELAAARARVGLAAVFSELGSADDARAALQSALPVLEARGEAAIQASALNQLGLLERGRGELGGAAELHAKAREVAARAGDLRQQAVALRNLAAVDRARGDLPRAIGRLEESIELQQAEGERRAVALVWRQVRLLHQENGDLGRAYQGLLRELELREGLSEPAALAATLQEGAGLARLVGKTAQAESWLGRAAELRAHQRDLVGAARALLETGLLLLEAGRPRLARRKLEAARDALGERGPVELRAELWRGFAESDLLRLEAWVREDDPHLALEEEGLDGDVTTDDATAEPQLARRAREEADEALSLARESGEAGLLAPALRALARACAHRGEKDRARELFRQALQAAEELRGPAWDLSQVQATYLEYGAWLGRQTGEGAGDGPAGEGPTRRAAVDYLERAALLAEEAARLGVVADHAARARAALAALHLHLGDRVATQAALDRARAHLGSPDADEAPGGARSRLRRALAQLDQRARRGEEPRPGELLREAEARAKSQMGRLAGEAQLREALIDLRRLQELAKALNTEPELDRLLNLIIDASIELSGAERGFLILVGPDKSSVAFRVARNVERGEVERPDRKVSNTIARRAIESGAPVVTGDAARDDRFAGALSVAEQRLRSVVSVPLRARGTVTGALYLDHRYKEGLFDQRAVGLLESLADHAAIALENARLNQDARERASTLQAEREKLRSTVESQTIELHQVRQRLAERARDEGARTRYQEIVGRSTSIQRVFQLMDKVVDSNIPVFIHGESGTGKELIARALHQNGPRREGPFVSENFGAIVEELIASELFGHVKGSFTGAIDDKRGLFERAHGGTIFLDEVGDLSEQMQKELLRVLEEREVRRVGGDKAIPVDVRVISATHRDLKQMVSEGSFRQDLFYRLHVFAIDLPPLRERKEDVALLVEKFLGDLAERSGQAPRKFEPEALRLLLGYRWPGNVRELKNFVERTVLMARGEVIRAEEVSFEQGGATSGVGVDEMGLLPWNEAKEAFARHYLTSVLSRVGGNVSLAARESGMLRQAFQRLVKRHAIDPEEFRRSK